MVQTWAKITNRQVISDGGRWLTEEIILLETIGFGSANKMKYSKLLKTIVENMSRNQKKITSQNYENVFTA